MNANEAIAALKAAKSQADIEKVAAAWSKEHGFDTLKDENGKEVMAIAAANDDLDIPVYYSYLQQAWKKIPAVK